MKASDSVHNLWSFYMAASFAAAGYAASAKNLSRRSAALMTIGYVIFLIGHISMLINAISIENVVATDLSRPLAHDKASAFGASLQALVAARDSVLASLIIHGGIDLCIVAVIWVAALRPARR